MATAHPVIIPDLRAYEEAADEAFRSQTLEEIMESTTQSTQRGITVASFDMIRAIRPDIHCFSELMILYPKPGAARLARVVPDNMVVVHPGRFGEKQSYNIPREPVGPLMVMEYVSKGNPRKDNVANMRKYERDVRVPYYLLFEPDKDRHVLYHLPAGKTKFAAVKANRSDRLPIPELELEIGLLDGWLRFWFRAELMPLPGEMAGRLAAAENATRVAKAARESAEAEVARLKAELDRLRRP